MKKAFNLLLAINILFLSFSPVVAYETKRGTIASTTGTGANIRSGPGTNHGIITSLPDGSNVTIIGEAPASEGCSSGWYKLEYSQEAYVCSSIVYVFDSEGTGSVAEEFPADYKVLLENLQQIYPNAIFKPVMATNSIPNASSLGTLEMEFGTAVYNQYYTQSKSLVWDSNGSRDGWKNLESYNYDTNSFRNDYSGGGPTWYSANPAIISYYLDPRNFLNIKDVFMFESLAYDASVHTIDGVQNILKGSYMETEKVDGGTLSFAEVIMEAGKLTNVSPYFLASRIRLEVGSGRSALVQGTYESYPQFNGYYNYYNIGAGGENVVYNGLQFAYDSGWNSEYTAIIKGAEWIKADYVQSGDSTNYTQKWDVFCEGRTTCFNKQYMQNIQAPKTEAGETYNAYFKILGESMYQTPFIFYIPVFKNMPESSPLPSTSSPINYLNTLTVDGNLVTNFYGLKYDYELVVPYNKTSINIGAVATAASKGATVSGTGNVQITEKNQTFNITVTAANGNILIYSLKVTRLDPDEELMSYSETIEKLTSVKIEDILMSGVTSLDVLKESFNKANPNALVLIRDKNGNILTDGNTKTGDKITVTVGDVTKEYTYVLYGDPNGDAIIDIVDLLYVQKHLLNSVTLTNEYLESCDVNRDNVVDIVDLLLVQKHLLNVTYINQ